MRTIKTCTVGFAGLVLTAFGVGASAADKGNEFAELESIMLEEIVVTARRREESAQTVPVAITAITADDLVSRSAFVLSDIAKEAPSLSIQSRTSDQNTQIIQLRGQVQGDAAATLDPSVGLYLNDIYVSRNNGANFELFDVERVEILAGPQGTLYGRNTTGGAIKLITTPADLKGKMNGYAAVAGGNFSNRRAEGAINIPVSDNFAVRVAGLGVSRDGYTKVRVGTLNDASGLGLDGAAPFTVNKVLDTDDKNTQAGRLSATFEPTEKLSFNFVGDYTKQSTNGTLGYDQGNTLIAAPALPTVFFPQVDPNAPPVSVKPFGNYTKCSTDFYTACYSFTPKSDTEVYGAALTSAYDTDIGTAKLIYGYRDVEGIYQSDLEGTPLNFGSLTVPTATRQNTVELQLQGETQSVDYTVGLYYFREKGNESFRDFNFLNASVRSFDSDVDNESKSIYGQTGYALTKTVRLTTGLRYTQDDKGIDATAVRLPAAGLPGQCLYTQSGFLLNPTPDNCRFKRSDDFSHLSWTAGFDWQPVEGILAYIKASEGYRSGGQNVRGLGPVDQQPFDEETIRDVELGLKSKLAERVRLNLTYYHSKYSGIQVTQFLILPLPQTTTTQVLNAGTADIDGVEAQTIYVATDNVSFDLTGSYTNVDYSNPDTAAALTPKFKGSVATNFLFPMSFGDIKARIGYSYQGKFGNGGSKVVQASVPETVSAGRGLLDARLAFEIKPYNLNVALFGTNLTDKEYTEVVTPLIAPNRNPDGTVAIPGAGDFFDVFNRIQVGAPRMFGLEMRKRF